MKTMAFFKRTSVCAVLLAAVALTMTSCLSLPDETPDNDRELVQLAQSAYDSGRTKLAKFYYTELIRKFGSDPSIYVEGCFELAHIAIKKKQYDEAVPLLEEVEMVYNYLPPGTLPGAYRKLAQQDLAKVPEEKLEAAHRKMQEAARKAAAEAEAQAAAAEQ